MRRNCLQELVGVQTKGWYSLQAQQYSITICEQITFYGKHLTWIMFPILSQAHNQNKFAFLLKMRLKTGYNWGSLTIFCFCQVTQPLLYMIEDQWSAADDRLAHLCPCLLCACPAIFCGSHLLEVWVHLQNTSIQYKMRQTGNTRQNKSIKCDGPYKFACKSSGTETKMLSQKYHAQLRIWRPFVWVILD